MVPGYEEYSAVTVHHAYYGNSKGEERQSKHIHPPAQSLRAPVWTAGGSLGIIDDLAPAHLRCNSPEDGVDPAPQQ